MNNEHWKSNLLKYILSIGSVTLVGFTFVYMYEGNKVMALGEGFVALCMLFSIFWIKPDKYLGPAVVGWSGVFWVLVTLLFTGGIAGAGVVWWGLMPIISFMLFGLTGGFMLQWLSFLL